MNYTILGLFENKSQTETAVSKLTSKGMDRSNIDVSPYRAEGDYEGKDYDYDRNEKNEGFWNWLFGNDSKEKEQYSKAGARSHLVTVYANDRPEAVRASETLDEAGAKDVDEIVRGNAQRTTTDRPAQRPQAGTTGQHTSKEKGSVDVVKEDIQVGKREVKDGDVRLKSRIIEKPVEENVRLKDERVYIKRKPANRPATNSDLKEDSVTMKESHEEPVVNKKARVVEEVSLEKDVEHKDRKIKDTVKETKVDVDNRNNS